MQLSVFDLILQDDDGNLYEYVGDCSWIADQNFEEGDGGDGADAEVKKIENPETFFLKYFKNLYGKDIDK